MTWGIVGALTPITYPPRSRSLNYLTKATVFLILCSITVFFLHREEQRGSFAGANQTYIDWLIGNSKQKIREPSVTYLRINEDTFKIFESEGRFGPVDFALLFDKLREYDPKVTAVVPVLSFPDTDELLVNTLKNGALKFDSLLLGCVFEQNPAGQPISDGVLSLLGSIESVTGDLSQIPEFTNAKSLPEVQLRITSKIAFTEIDLVDETTLGRDGLVVPLLARHKNTVVPGFLLQSVLMENGLTLADVKVELGHQIQIGEDITIPIDNHGFMTVFTGLRERLPVYGADILLWDSDAIVTGADIGAGLSIEERAALEKRVVLIGYDDEMAKRIPYKGGAKISHSELFSLAIATIQSGRYIRKVPALAQFGIWGAIALIGLIILRMYRRRAIVSSVLLLILFFIAGMIQFQINQSWTPLSIPLSLIACIALSGLVLCQSKPRPVEAD